MKASSSTKGVIATQRRLALSPESGSSMPSNIQPLTDEELEEFENGRDLGKDLLK